MSGNVMLRRGLAALVIAAGAVIAWASGSWAWELLSPAFGGFRGTDEELFALAMVLLFGVVPALAGLAMVWGGTVLWRSKGKIDQ